MGCNPPLVPVCGGFCCCFWFIFACAAIPCSLKSLAQGKYALQLSWTTQKIGDQVVTEPGIYTVGLGNMLVEFPSTFQTMYFVSNTKGVGSDGDIVKGTVRARSHDGLEMLISASFQWKLEPQALRPLYAIMGDTDYRDELVRFARASFVEACSHFPADSFFTNRTQITSVMLETLTTYFNRPAKGLQVSIQGLQLREVDLPDAFDSEISATQEAMQDVDVAIAEREQQRIIKERDMLVAEQTLKQNIQAALGEAGRIKLENEATVKQILVFQEQQAKANAAILQLFANDTDPYARLFEVMEVRALGDHTSAKLMVNM